MNIRPINILSKGESLDLEKGKYYIDILGGWNINLGCFELLFRNKSNQEIYEPLRATWPVQSYAKGRRAKRIYTIVIPESGEYLLEFRNPESIILKHSNLMISSMFLRPVPTDRIEILVK